MFVSVSVFGQNSRIKDLQTEWTATSSTYFVVDRADWQRAKKMLLSTVTSLEEAARILQDNTIEAGCGLNAAGVYVPDNTTNFIRAADFAAAGITGSLAHADWLLDSILYAIITAAGGDCYDFDIDTIYGCGEITIEDRIKFDSVVTSPTNWQFPVSISDIIVTSNNISNFHFDDTQSYYEFNSAIGGDTVISLSLKIPNLIYGGQFIMDSVILIFKNPGASTAYIDEIKIFELNDPTGPIGSTVLDYTDDISDCQTTCKVNILSSSISVESEYMYLMHITGANMYTTDVISFYGGFIYGHTE